MSTLIDGSKRAAEIREEIKNIILEQHAHPSLAIVLVGNDPASKLYVSLKEKACKEVGIDFNSYYLESTTSQAKLNEVIDFLNADDTINAILVQLPLPSHLNEDEAIKRISPAKDVDGFGPVNLEAYKNNAYGLEPGLTAGIKDLILQTKVELSGKNGLIIANNPIFADPIITMLKRVGVSAEYISPDDVNLNQKCLNADIVIIAIGRKWFLDISKIKKDAILIDVGTNKIDGITYGDINPNTDEIAAFRSPVPGGVGPMTVAMLLRNTLQLFLQQHEME